MPVFVVRLSPSPKSQTYSSMIVGAGVVESRASKLTVSPTSMVRRSAEILAFGVVEAKPVQPAREVMMSSAARLNPVTLSLSIEAIGGQRCK
jgi:hypothetical protein